MLNTKQRATLRAMANPLEPIIHIGKGGINEHLIKQVDDALTARELIKGTVQENAEYTAKEALQVLCQRVCAEPVQAIGRKFVLYRRCLLYTSRCV